MTVISINLWNYVPNINVWYSWLYYPLANTDAFLTFNGGHLDNLNIWTLLEGIIKQSVKLFPKASKEWSVLGFNNDIICFNS